jgi:short-subunit dehydrogenase
MQNILILGATSGIAQALAQRYAQQGKTLFLVARDQAKLDIMRDDLKLRGAREVATWQADFTQLDEHKTWLNDIFQHAETIDIAVIAYGTLGDQSAAEADFQTAHAELLSNFISPVALLTDLAKRFEARGSGSLVVLSSVAGDRGRQSNYVYGAAKGGLTIFLQGLRNRLAPKGIQVLTVKPGFVDTPMTAHLAKNVLYASADKVAADIDNGVKKGKKVLYTPWFWRFIMLIITHIPEFIFVRLKL